MIIHGTHTYNLNNELDDSRELVDPYNKILLPFEINAVTVFYF